MDIEKLRLIFSKARVQEILSRTKIGSVQACGSLKQD